MTKEQFDQEMKKHSDRFDEVWKDVVKTVRKFKEAHPACFNKCDFPKEAENLLEAHLLGGAWIHDELTNHSGITGNNNYRGSLAKKIRKALGYNL